MSASRHLPPVLGVLVLLLACTGAAHEVRPAYLELVEDANGRVASTWKLPVLDGRMLEVTPRLPEHCVAVGDPEVFMDPALRIERQRHDCGERGLSAGRVAIVGLPLTLIDVLVRIERPGTDARTALLRPEAPVLMLQGAPSAGGASAYLALGVEHILLGLDHLAFVLGLMLLVAGPWMLVKTITAFTIAHSLTLALATFGILGLPSATVETLIALSILFLAVEVLDRERGRDGPLGRSPWIVAFGFGLLHGLGFAGALRDIGLPADAVPLALLLFNIGVEAGQLLFVAVVLGAAALLRERARWMALVPRLAAYLIGVPAAYWSIDRLAGMLERI